MAKKKATKLTITTKSLKDKKSQNISQHIWQNEKITSRPAKWIFDSWDVTIIQFITTFPKPPRPHPRHFLLLQVSYKACPIEIRTCSLKWCYPPICNLYYLTWPIFMVKCENTRDVNGWVYNTVEKYRIYWTSAPINPMTSKNHIG